MFKVCSVYVNISTKITVQLILVNIIIYECLRNKDQSIKRKYALQHKTSSPAMDG